MNKVSGCNEIEQGYRECMYVVIECCSESRMRSRTSRGVPKWSGGKDLYMESCCSGSGKSSGFSGIVPESFQKVPKDSRGVRRSGNCSTTSNTAAWAVGGALALMGQGHQPPQGPCAWERGNPKGEGLHLTWEALLPPLAAPQAPSRAGRTP